MNPRSRTETRASSGGCQEPLRYEIAGISGHHWVERPMIAQASRPGDDSYLRARFFIGDCFGLIPETPLSTCSILPPLFKKSSTSSSSLARGPSLLMDLSFTTCSCDGNAVLDRALGRIAPGLTTFQRRAPGEGDATLRGIPIGSPQQTVANRKAWKFHGNAMVTNCDTHV